MKLGLLCLYASLGCRIPIELNLRGVAKALDRTDVAHIAKPVGIRDVLDCQGPTGRLCIDGIERDRAAAEVLCVRSLELPRKRSGVPLVEDVLQSVHPIGKKHPWCAGRIHAFVVDLGPDLSLRHAQVARW